MATTTTRADARPLPHDHAPGSPRWTRPALWLLLAATAALYLWGLGGSGWANAFYSAAAQAGAASWKALFYGSSDAANSITVDKTPASLWLMGLSVRVFGLSSWSVLVPQALCGVASVAVLHAAVRRWAGPVAGLLAGAVLAVTPVAVLMFRFNNPDALLVLLLVLGAYWVVRAVDDGRTRWLVLAGAAVGFGFLTKMLQAFLVLPAFALVYLVAGPTPVRRRIWQLVLAGVAVLVSAGWWVAVVELVPARYRPYVGGSQHNSVLELALGYNGLGRLTGNETGGLGNTNRDVGWDRLFAQEMGGQVAWLLPAALVALVAGLVLTRRAPRTDRTRAGLLLWGGWLVVTGVLFSFMNGIVHPYYTVALAPAVGALVGIGAVLAWRERHQVGGVLLSSVTAVTAVWAAVLLARTPDWQPWLRLVVLVAGFAAAVLLLFVAHLPVAAARGVSAVAAVAVLAAPVGYALATAATPHSGAIPSAGPAGAFGFLRFAGPGGAVPGGAVPGGAVPGGAVPGGAVPGGAVPRGVAPGGFRMGGVLDAVTPSAAVTSAVNQRAGDFTWVAAVVGSNAAAGYQLATGHPVLPLGGFNGTDPAPTLAQFQDWVRAGKVHYLIGGGLAGFGGRPGVARTGSDDAQRIVEWVEQHFPVSTVDGVTLYDLTAR